MTGWGARVEQVAGGALGGAFAAATALRRDKPIHNRGTVYDATVIRTGAASAWGVAWLDEPGTDQGVVRLSRSVGLPAPVPDVLGMALRFADAAGRHDLLLATTGMRPGLRQLLVPRVDALAATYGSLVTYHGARRSVLFSAVPAAGADAAVACFGLRVATPVGAWEQFATVALSERSPSGPPPGGDDDESIDFDPVHHPLPGLVMAPAITRLREPAYRLSRRTRGS